MEPFEPLSVQLPDPYHSILRNGTLFPAGNQNWFRRAWLRRSGCALIAAADLLLYLRTPDCSSSLFRDLPPEGTIPGEAYDRYLERFCRRFPPAVPRLGMNAWTLCLGLNLCFRTCRLPYRARWGVRRRRLWDEAEAMLGQGLPVILCVGPNFPLFWRKNQLTFYAREGDRLRPATRTKAHFVTVTGLSQRWLRIVSWGQVYYIRRSEFMAYAERYSSYLLCNIVRIRKTQS